MGTSVTSRGYLLVLLLLLLLQVCSTTQHNASMSMESCENRTSHCEEIISNTSVSSMDDKCHVLWLYQDCLEQSENCTETESTETEHLGPSLNHSLGHTKCIGDECTIDEECEGTHQHCHGNYCACAHASHHIQGVCRAAEEGDPCMPDDDVSCGPNMHCDNATVPHHPHCACVPGYVSSANHSCIPAKMLGDPCNPGDHVTCGPIMHCDNETDPHHPVCACAYDYTPGTNNTCVPKVEGSPCDPDDHMTCGPIMHCNNMTDPAHPVCVCASGSTPNANHSCIPKVEGSACDADDHMTCGPNMHCDNITDPDYPMCACFPDSTANAYHTCIPKVAGASCTAGHDNTCGDNMFCDVSFAHSYPMCACMPAFKQNEHHACIPRVIGDPCGGQEEDACPHGFVCQEGHCQCDVINTFRNDGTDACSTSCATGYGDDGTGTCAESCSVGFTGDVDACIAKVVGDPCDASDNATCSQHMVCDNSTELPLCACAPAFRVVDNGSCIAKALGDACDGGNASCGRGMFCTDGTCTCDLHNGFGDDGTGHCGVECALTYIGVVGQCRPKVMGDNCTGNGSTSCGEGMVCMEDTCTCNLDIHYGDDGTGVCALACAPSHKGSVGSCEEKTLGDGCGGTDGLTCAPKQVCIGHLCGCRPGLHHDGTGRCSGNCARGFRDYGSACVPKIIGDVCTGSGTEATCGAHQLCVSGRCACTAGHKNDGTGACAVECAPGFMEEEGACTVKRIGSLCFNGDASTCGQNQVCVDDTCFCNVGYTDDGTGSCGEQCAPHYARNMGKCTEVTVGSGCRDSGDCGHHQSCSGGTCGCLAGYLDAGPGVCRHHCLPGYRDTGLGCKEVPVSAVCSGDIDCGLNQFCGPKNTCECNASFRQSGLACLDIEVRSPCQGDRRECGLHQRCLTSTSECQCERGYTPNTQHYCREVGLGDNCILHEDTTCGSHQVCGSARTCVCKISHKHNGNGVCIEKTVGDRCTTGLDLSCGANQRCSGAANKARCICKDGFMVNDFKTCSEKVLGDECDEESGCPAMFRCWDGTCLCPVGQTPESGVCVDIRVGTVCQPGVVSSCGPGQHCPVTGPPKCTCNNGLKVSGTACIAKLDGDDCASDATCGANQECSDAGTCRCMEHYHAIGSACMEVTIGTRCNVADDCGLNQVCMGSPKICTCAPTFMDDGKGLCRRECSKDFKKDTHGHCIGIAVMEPCHSRADCGSNQECVGGRCHCQPGFRADDNKHCMPLSLSCQAKVLQCDNDPTNVPSTGNVPERYKCLFKAKYMSCLSSGSKGCSVEETSAQLDRLSDEYGIGPCEAGLTQECTPGIICTAEHASCHLNLCMCDKDFYTLDGLTCNPKKPFNAECSADVECLTHGACRQSMCTCADHFRLKGGRCVDIPAGNTCSERNVTRACGTNQFCKEQRCVCATRFTSNPVTSLCVAKTVGSSCLGDADCGPHQVCANSFCACDTYYAVDITTSLCSPVMVGDVCAGDDNCGVAQSCSQGFCQCRSGYSLPQGTVICVETAPPEEENRGTALSSTTLTLLWTLAFLAPLHVRHLL